MTRKNLSDALTFLDDRYLREAAEYTAKPTGFLRKAPVRSAIAALLALCLFFGGLHGMNGGASVSAYARDTREPLTRTGTTLMTGTISDSGVMTGHSLMFYLSGEGIARVRFSCKNQRISFTDWTEQRPAYANAQSFTVDYGANADEYDYLVLDWTPTETIRALTDHAETSIATLPAELREDVIVLEITFENGTTDVKAITVALGDDGAFTAAFDDYTLTEADTFVHRPDAQPVSSTLDDTHDDQPDDTTEATDAAEQAAREAALAYYDGTVFTVEALTLLDFSAREASFSVLVRKGGVLQEPARTVWLTCADGVWTVVNEGY